MTMEIGTSGRSLGRERDRPEDPARLLVPCAQELKKPRLRGGLAARASGSADIDGESCGRRGEKRGGIADLAPVGALPADPRLLHDVIRLTRASEDPMSDSELREHLAK